MKKSDKPNEFFTVRLKESELKALEELARRTDRSRGAVVRALILLAASDPTYRKALGVLPVTYLRENQS